MDTTDKLLDLYRSHYRDIYTASWLAGRDIGTHIMTFYVSQFSHRPVEIETRRGANGFRANESVYDIFF